MERDPSTPSARWRRLAVAERAATLVEYALIVAVFALGTLGAIDLLQSSAEKTAGNTADNISSPPR